MKKTEAAKGKRNKMKIKLLNIDSSKTDTIEVSDKVINQKVNHKLIKYVVDWQLNHSKPRTAKTKQKNEIKGSTKKIVPQKEVAEPDMQVGKHQFLLEGV